MVGKHSSLILGMFVHILLACRVTQKSKSVIYMSKFSGGKLKNYPAEVLFSYCMPFALVIEKGQYCISHPLNI